MSAGIGNGKARALSTPMLTALHSLYYRGEHGIGIGNVAVAVALVQRGFAVELTPTKGPQYLALYRITEHGKIAYRIAARHAGVTLKGIGQ